ncbi:DNA topoisomerase III [Heyndrickxia shackletonii]|uniref:DNA topoisomerase n=1 Tax=Heyndrickxia shackletonii TaxID=157838 RepID=A0A0Q3X0L0_9BACI|nr:DNA topoisomerase III [Heyndrickxia shackletonii]KQL54868.1 DNA topoisomerase III [Heyndrickxia shackletonii]NEY99480.1 DNA topoisomerase III [Heyndrickxia shackletonii]
MKLIIAEKPDQGLKLASPFSYTKKDGYVEISPNQWFPNGALLTWAIGHLCELVPPEEYDPKWKKWSLETLPIIPNHFQHRVTKSKWKQFNIIKGFVNRKDIDEIIIAGDAEREGEAIVRIILEKCNNQKKMKRLWISSLTPKSVIHGFENLLEESETRSIYYEALSRACADWLVGMNASRAYTLLLQKKGISDVFSTGRVQTPTLALIVKREKEIENFKSEPFWEVLATFHMDGKNYSGKWHKDGETRLQDESMAKKIAEFCKGKEAIISSIEKERKEFQPPLFFNLSALQATANKLYKFSPKHTLDIAQKLYVKGIISYPRSDSSFVTKEEAASFPEILQKLSKLERYKDYFPLPKTSIINNSRYVNAKKVTDHYAIIPTEQVVNPTKMSADEEKIYSLIVERLIVAHYEKAIFDYTTIHTLVENRATFISKGKEQIQEGWRAVIYKNNSEQKNENQEDDQDLPSLQEGEKGIVKAIKVKGGKTQPPKRYTEGQLITLMKTAGKHLEDEELIKVLNKTEGLGTEATRAGIIGVLKDRKYIEVKKNQVFATNKGTLLIESIGDSLLASPEMTAKWEQRLHEIGEGKASPNIFMEQAKKLSIKLINDARENSGEWDFQHFDLTEFQKNKTSKNGKKLGTKLGKCRKCDGDVVDKGKIFGCSNYNTSKCDFAISKKILGRSISQTNIKKLLTEGSTDFIKGFKKDGKEFTAKLEWKDNKISFLYK